MIRLCHIPILLITIILSQGIHGKRKDIKESTVYFSSESHLTIKGKTNVSKFKCEFDMQVLSDSIRIDYTEHNDYLRFENAILILPNFEFDCGGKMINKDFHKLLNTSQYPKISLILKQINPIKTDTTKVNATVEIMICDIVNTYTVPISVSDTDQLCIDGVLPLDINDFNLTAPSKALGMIKVIPQIEIEFSLKLFKC